MNVFWVMNLYITWPNPLCFQVFEEVQYHPNLCFCVDICSSFDESIYHMELLVLTCTM